MVEESSRSPNPARGEERRPASTWDHPDEQPAGGSVSANDTARPRDREAQEGTEGVVAGFTQTSSSGSVPGRSLYGLAPEEEPDAPE